MVQNIKVAFERVHLPIPEQVQIFNNIAFIFIIVHFMKKKNCGRQCRRKQIESVGWGGLDLSDILTSIKKK